MPQIATLGLPAGSGGTSSTPEQSHARAGWAGEGGIPIIHLTWTRRLQGASAGMTVDQAPVIAKLGARQPVRVTATARAGWYQAIPQRAASDAQDLPFAMIYPFEPGTNVLALAGASGIAPGHQAAPARIPFDDKGIWPLAEIIRKQQPSIVADLRGERFAALPTGAWRQPPAQAVGGPRRHSFPT